MQTEKKAEKTTKKERDVPSLVLKIVFLVIAVLYIALLIFGRWIFAADNVFYVGLNIFIQAEAPNIWLRSLGYIIFLSALSYVVRLGLKQCTRFLKRGKALLDLLCSFIKYIAVIAMIFAVLSVWGVDTAALIAGIGILSLIVGLGAQPLIEDIIAGLFIVFEGIYDVGDIIVVDNFRGTVKEIGIRTTQIEDAGGDVKVINNSDIRTLVNMTSQLSLAICDVDIEYDESLERVELIIKENLTAIREKIPDIAEGPFYLGVAALGASGVTLRFTANCRESEKFQVQRDLNRQIKLLFDRHGINIPFTQIVVHAPAPASVATETTAITAAPMPADKAPEAARRAADEFVDEQRELTRGMSVGDEQNL